MHDTGSTLMPHSTRQKHWAAVHNVYSTEQLCTIGIKGVAASANTLQLQPPPILSGVSLSACERLCDETAPRLCHQSLRSVKGTLSRRQ